MMDRNFLIPVWDSIVTAWHKVRGSKATIWAAILVAIVIVIALYLIDYAVAQTMPAVEPLVSIIVQIINYLLQAGLLYIGIQRANDFPINYRMVFRALEWRFIWRLVVLYILQALIILPFVILIMIPTIISTYYKDTPPPPEYLTWLSPLLILIGVIGIIYLTVRMMLAMGFVVDRVTGPATAIKYSFQATASNFWRLVLIIILEMIIIIISMLPLLIGIIWTYPFAIILYGIVYRSLAVNVRSI